MVQIASANDTGATNNAFFSTTKKDAAKDSQDMFVTLLLAQVKHQDPMKPMDNMEFTNQLASFNQLSEMQKVNANLEKQNDLNSTMSQTSYLNLLDKKVSALGSDIVVTKSGSSQQIEYNLDGKSENTVMTIVDESGMVRATLNLGAKNSGDNTYNWDGKDSNGLSLPAGTYNIQLSGAAASGAPVFGKVYSSGIVSTVTSTNGETVIKLTNGQSIMTKDILKVESLQPPTVQ